MSAQAEVEVKVERDEILFFSALTRALASSMPAG